MAVEVVMPRLSDSMEDGTILRWLVAEGDPIRLGQPLAEIETDKATVTYEADAEGSILALNVAEGASVPVGVPIAVIGSAGEQLPASRAPGAVAAAEARDAGGAIVTVASPSPASGAAPTAAPRSPAHGHSFAALGGRPARAKASPLARRIAAELGVDLASLSGSGPQGRVIRADVERAATRGDGGAAASPGDAARGAVSVHELTRMQRTVARRMAESRASVPDIELRREVDMGEAVALRDKLREVSDPVPSLNDLIVKAAALALREFPRVNGSYRESGFEMHGRVNVGIAVAAEDALVVPTIFDADTKSLVEITRDTRAVAARARDGSVAPGELEGATFTVSNLGMYGVDSFSAVINPPQAAILAVGALRTRPVVEQFGAVVARPTIILTLACDHRILYGADGARFLGRVTELLERPLSLLV